LFTATLIAKECLGGILDEVAYQFDHDCTAGKLSAYEWIEDDVAADLIFAPSAAFSEEPDCAHLADGIREMALSIAKGGYGLDLALDVVVQAAIGREKRLLVADMDSTMITVECIDELADFAGLKSQVAAVTEAAMRGELDFEAALEARVALLAGLGEQAIECCREERVRLTPGAARLVRTMRARGGLTLLVSGGFTRFAEPVADQIGFDRAMANVLIVEDGKLTGAVRRPYVGAEAKREALLAAAAELGIGLECALAVGDGANDLPMIQAAGLGVAYRAKPVLAQAADARIDHNDLTALLYAQDIPRAEWVED
jgi:phosphoserine phosphatase